MRPPGLLIVATVIALSGCTVNWTGAASSPTLTVSGSEKEVVAFVDAQIERYPEMAVTRKSDQASGHARSTLTLPPGVTGDELAEMTGKAVEVRLSYELAT